uniref:RING-type E3 ubiquitin transferase n=1 Tax=Ornithorhynchus anatinus TaxID=9258 RepID=K7E9I1_ORNAN
MGMNRSSDSNGGGGAEAAETSTPARGRPGNHPVGRPGEHWGGRGATTTAPAHWGPPRDLFYGAGDFSHALSFLPPSPPPWWGGGEGGEENQEVTWWTLQRLLPPEGSGPGGQGGVRGVKGRAMKEVDSESVCRPGQASDCVDGQILSQLQRISEEEEEEEEERGLARQPTYPDMEPEEMRRATFHNWPLNAMAQPEQLARAGFFYSGHRDKVTCYYCDGGLRNWEQGDDPWREHAKWFPRCEFLLQARGRDYVNSICDLYFTPMESLGSSGELNEQESTVAQGPVKSAPETPAVRMESQPECSEEAGNLSTEEQLQRLQEERTCKVCMDRMVSIVFVPCGHLVVCTECAPNLQHCPICRALIRGSVRTFMS